MVTNTKNFFENKRVLITGHTGFKGSWLLLLILKMGANVCGYSLKPDPDPNLFKQLKIINHKNFKHLEGDINNTSSLNKVINDFQPDFVFHLAAQALVRKSYKEPINTWSTNVIGTLNL